MIIAQAGGLDGPGYDRPFIYRQGEDGKQTRIAVRLEDLIMKGNQDLNIMLQPKDVVAVPIDLLQNVFVYGEVATLGHLFSDCQEDHASPGHRPGRGTTEWAKRSDVVIKRKDKKTDKEMKIPVKL